MESRNRLMTVWKPEVALQLSSERRDFLTHGDKTICYLHGGKAKEEKLNAFLI